MPLFLYALAFCFNGFACLCPVFPGFYALDFWSDGFLYRQNDALEGICFGIGSSELYGHLVAVGNLAETLWLVLCIKGKLVSHSLVIRKSEHEVLDLINGSGDGVNFLPVDVNGSCGRV